MSQTPEESQLVEAKRSLSERREGLEALGGMMNTDLGTGTTIFGKDPSGAIVGVEPGDLDRAQQTLSQHMANKFQPPPILNVEVQEKEGKRLLLVRGERPRGVPYVEYDGRAFIRVGTTTRQLSLEEKHQLQRRRGREFHPGPWRCDKCGEFAGTVSGVVVTSNGVERNWKHRCGGEWWPAT